MYTLPIVYKLYRPLYHSLHHVLFIMLLDSLFNSNSNLDKIMPLMLKFSEILTICSILSRLYLVCVSTHNFSHLTVICI